MKRWLVRLLVPLLIAGGVMAAYQVAWRTPDALVVYCAHDAVYSQQILRDFEKQTGIPVQIRFDTEATKSLGLVELIAREKSDPRCDVFWNNELLGTLALKEQGLTEAYKGSGYARIPEQYRDADGHWAGFGARLRVYIVNTEKMDATPDAVRSALAGDLSRVAIAKPLYGTTLTHYSLLWDRWGGEKLQGWHADWRRRGVREVNGNALVRNLVADGVCDLGLTDTDDYFGAIDKQRPVRMVPVRTDDGQVICIPNTVSIIRGTKRSAAARKLVDYLLSAKVELALARSTSRQVPLGPVEASELPAEVAELKALVPDGAPLGRIGPARAACLAWLKSQYVR